MASGQPIRRFVRRLLLLFLIVLAIPAVGLAFGFLATKPLGDVSAPGVKEDPPALHLAEMVKRAVPRYERPEVATFLVYPQWAVIYAARDYAGFVRFHSPSEFPYLAYIGRFWRDAATMIRVARPYRFEAADYALLVGAGTGFTIEASAEWAYENTIGRLSLLAAGGSETPEDRFQARAAAEYASFLDQLPWYRFDFASQRRRLWEVPTARGPQAIRSWERKLSGATAYTIKQIAAYLTGMVLGPGRATAERDLHVWAKGPVAAAIRSAPKTRLDKDFGADGMVFTTPAGHPFTALVPRLISDGVRFVEIAGNDEILVTALCKDIVFAPAGAKTLFAYRIPADPDFRRTALIVSVRHLHQVLPALVSAGARIENIYDY